MASQIQVMNEEKKRKKKETNFAEVVCIVIKTMNISKGSEISHEVSKEEKNHLNCDICQFNSKKEYYLIAHMVQIHGGCHSYDLSAQYF